MAFSIPLQLEDLANQLEPSQICPLMQRFLSIHASAFNILTSPLYAIQHGWWIPNPIYRYRLIVPKKKLRDFFFFLVFSIIVFAKPFLYSFLIVFFQNRFWIVFMSHFWPVWWPRPGDPGRVLAPARTTHSLATFSWQSQQKAKILVLKHNFLLTVSAKS